MLMSAWIRAARMPGIFANSMRQVQAAHFRLVMSATPLMSSCCNASPHWTWAMLRWCLVELIAMPKTQMKLKASTSDVWQLPMRNVNPWWWTGVHQLPNRFTERLAAKPWALRDVVTFRCKVAICRASKTNCLAKVTLGLDMMKV